MLAAEDDAAFHARIVKRLGRLARGDAAGVLTAEESTRLWADVLEQKLSPSREAAVLMALRIHGETPAMLAAFMQATRQRCTPVNAPGPAGSPAVVVLYALGTARRQPVLAPLLALRTAAHGAPVLLVTHAFRPDGAHAAAVLAAMGEAPCADAAGVAHAWQAGRVAWLPTTALSPPLARVLDRRAELGFRNAAHALVKVLAPVDGAAVVVANYTHPPYRATFAAIVAALGQSALLVRGTEGDPVAWEAERHPSEAWLRGRTLADDASPAVASSGDADAAPTWPAPDDIAGTVRFCCAARDGVVPVPAALERQARMLAALARRAGHEESTAVLPACQRPD